MHLTALYPGKFDPFHNGHLDIVQRAVVLFDELVIAVYDPPESRPLFDAGERADLVRAGVCGLSQVRVVTYTGLTVDAAREQGAQTVVRGLRNPADFEYERQVGMANRRMAPGIEHCLLMTCAEYAFLSATILKEVAGLDGDVSGWAPESTVAALRGRFAAADRKEGDSPDLRARTGHAE